jgi:hypothetical protein
VIYPGSPLCGKHTATYTEAKIQLDTITPQLPISAMESNEDLSYGQPRTRSDYQDSVRSLAPARVLRHTGPSINPRLLRDNHSLFRLPTPALPFRPSNLSSYRANRDREDEGEAPSIFRRPPYISGPVVTEQQTEDFLPDGFYPNFVRATFRVDITPLARSLIISPPNPLNLFDRGYHPPRHHNTPTFDREPSRVSLYPRLESPPLTPITAAMRWTHIWEWISSDSVYLPSPLLSFPDPETLPGCFAEYRDFANCYVRVAYGQLRSISVTGSDVEY